MPGKVIIINVIRVVASALVVVHLSALAVCHAEGLSDTAAYGSKVNFKAGRTVRFPDFELIYLGKRRITPPQFPRGWWIHDFKVLSKGAKQIVSWSAGTGDIGPTRFKVEDAVFQVELSRSDKLGPLRDDEMVVSSVTP